MNRPKIHRRFIRLLYNVALAGPLPLKVLSRQMASLLLRARSFGTRKAAKLLHPGPNGPATRRGAGDVSQGIMGCLCMHKRGCAGGCVGHRTEAMQTSENP